MKLRFIIGFLLLPSIVGLSQAPTEPGSMSTQASTYVQVQADKEISNSSLMTVSNYLNNVLRMERVAVSHLATTDNPVSLSELMARQTRVDADYLLLLTVKLSELNSFIPNLEFNYQAYDRSGQLLWDDGVKFSCGTFFRGTRCLDLSLDRALSPLLARYTSSLRTNPLGNFYQMYPVIRGFTPKRAPVGAQVVITGAGFVGATAIDFGGVKTNNYTVDSATQIRATVPQGAQSGKITVTSKRMGTTSSKAQFTVTP